MECVFDELFSREVFLLTKAKCCSVGGSSMTASFNPTLVRIEHLLIVTRPLLKKEEATRFVEFAH